MKSNLFLFSVCAGIGMGLIGLPVKSAHAQEVGTMQYYALTEADYTDNYQAWRRFVDYHVYREPCQGYVAPPDGYYMKGCNVYRIAGDQITENPMQIPPSQEFHAIYFDFDRSDIRINERQHVSDIARDLRQKNIDEVILMAHTDSSGEAGYNQRLSERRGHSVALALERYGIRAALIEEQAFGETNPAARLGDDVRSQENRRVIIKYKN